MIQRLNYLGDQVDLDQLVVNEELSHTQTLSPSLTHSLSLSLSLSLSSALCLSLSLSHTRTHTHTHALN